MCSRHTNAVLANSVRIVKVTVDQPAKHTQQPLKNVSLRTHFYYKTCVQSFKEGDKKMTNNGMIYGLNREEAVKEAERLREKLTPDQVEAHRRIRELESDEKGDLVSAFCIMDSVSKVDNCFYSMEAYRAIEEACYNAYMMGKASKE